ncbi:MAG TPA: hypothetical protein PLR99_16970 [Polyangiaceae bacterium]|nr:hypothetical protein [Polyangiaceae bacterium]
MLRFRSSVVRLGLVVAGSSAAAACTSFGVSAVPAPDAATPTPTATGLTEASAPDAALVDASQPDAALPDATTRSRACSGTPLAAFTSALQLPALSNLTVAGSPVFASTSGFVGYPMVAQIDPAVRGFAGLKGMANATVPLAARFCFEMWARVTVPAADAGGEVVVLQIGLGGSETIRIDFGAGARFGGAQIASFLPPSITEPHHWVVEVVPFAGKHRATLTIDGASSGEVTSPTLVGDGNTFLTFGASTDAAAAALVRGGRVVVGEAYATLKAN